MKVRNLSSTSVEVQWNEVKSVRGYVLVVDNGIQKARTTSIEGSSATSYQIHNLRPGHDFRVGGDKAIYLKNDLVFLFFRKTKKSRALTEAKHDLKI